MFYFFIYWAISVIYIGITIFMGWKKFKNFQKTHAQFKIFTEAIFKSANARLLYSQIWNPFTITIVGIPLVVIACPFVFPLSLISDVKNILGIKSSLQKEAEWESQALEKVRKKTDDFLKNEGIQLPFQEVRPIKDERKEVQFHDMNLKHLALYTKNHYQRGEFVWQDVKKCLLADDYQPDTREDMLQIIIRNVSPMFNGMTIPDYTRLLVEAIHPHNCSKYGFHVSEHVQLQMEKVDHIGYYYKTAILYFFLSKLQGATVDECGGLPEPDGNVLPLRQN